MKVDETVHLAALVRCLCYLRSPFLDFLGDDFLKMFSFSACVFVDTRSCVGLRSFAEFPQFLCGSGLLACLVRQWLHVHVSVPVAFRHYRSLRYFRPELKKFVGLKFIFGDISVLGGARQFLTLWRSLGGSVGEQVIS